MLQFLIERRSAALLVGLFVVCFTLMTVSARLQGRSTLIERGLFSFAGPIFYISDAPRKWAVGVWQRYLLLKNAHEENSALRRKLQSLSENHARMQELKSEIARLERLLQVSKNLASPVRLARIVAHDRSIYGKSLIVDLGSRDGVRKDMPVMHEAGLVGRISRVSRSMSQVLPLLDSRSAVSVIAQRSRAQGIFSISPQGASVVRHMPGDVEVKPGDLLISSGLGGLFPKGFPVARVTEVINEKKLFLNIKAKPLVKFSNLEEVLILMTPPRENPWK